MTNIIKKWLKTLTKDIDKTNKRKTIEQWLQDNLNWCQFMSAKRHKRDIIKYPWDLEVEKLSEAIDKGFFWIDMPEGYEYWHERFHKEDNLNKNSP